MFGSGIYIYNYIYRRRCPVDPSELQTYLARLEDELHDYWHGRGRTKDGRKKGREDFDRMTQPFLDEKGIDSSMASWGPMVCSNALRTLCRRWFEEVQMSNSVCHGFCEGFLGWCLSEWEEFWDPRFDDLLELLFLFLAKFDMVVKHPWACAWQKWHNMDCILEFRAVCVTRYAKGAVGEAKAAGTIVIVPTSRGQIPSVIDMEDVICKCQPCFCFR